MNLQELESITKDLYTLVELLSERIDILEDKLEQLMPTVN